MKNFAIGADIGGSHIATAAIDLTTARIVRGSVHRIHVDAQGTAQSILSTWADAILTSAQTVGIDMVKGVGLAMPGPFDYENGISLINDVSQNKFLSLYKMNVRDELSLRLGIPAAYILFKNDAECFLLGEVFGGAAKGAHRAIGVTLGTGFGSALMLDGKSEDANLWCAPFRGGYAEDFISTRWFLKRYQELTGRTPQGVKDLAGIVATDTDARTVFNEFGETLKEFMIPLVQKHQADTIVIGGNISLSWDLFISPLQQGLQQQGLSVKVLRAQLGEEAALIGSASLLDIKDER